jgi:hypothetical protein
MGLWVYDVVLVEKRNSYITWKEKDDGNITLGISGCR